MQSMQTQDPFLTRRLQYIKDNLIRLHVPVSLGYVGQRTTFNWLDWHSMHAQRACRKIQSHRAAPRAPARPSRADRRVLGVRGWPGPCATSCCSLLGGRALGGRALRPSFP